MEDRIDDGVDVKSIIEGPDIRVDDLAEASEKISAAQEMEDAKVKIGDTEFSAEEILKAAAALQQRSVRDALGRKLDLNAAAQVVNLRRLKTKDGTLNFADMTEEAAYDLEIPIVAKPFSNEDALTIDLKDKNYVARWVNVNPMRLGSMRSKGFLFVVAEDLASPLNIDIEVDAQGHYRCNDVVAMKISKDRYFPALKAAHLRAVAAVNSISAHKAAAGVANLYMEKEAGGEYAEYARKGNIKFYPTTGA
jgi:hypothetical protein